MKTGFITVSVGNNYVDLCERLAKSLKEHGNFPLHVYTCGDVFTEAAEVVKFSEFTNVPMKLNATFNYNLKGIATHHMFNNTDYDQIVFLDCDVIMTKETSAFDSMLATGDVWGSFDWFSMDHYKVQTGAKYKDIIHELGLGNDDYFFQMKYFTETFLLFNRTLKCSELLDKWAWICEQVSFTQITPAYECVELGMAMHLVNNGIECNQIKTTSINEEQIFLTEHRGRMLPVVRN